MAYAARDDVTDAATACNKAVNRFALELFLKHPVKSLRSSSVKIPRTRLEQIVKLAQFLVKTRAEVNYERLDGSWQPTGVNPSEGPHKVINYFKEIARSLALIHERQEVNDDDVGQIKHIAISSAPSHLRPVLWELVAKGNVDTNRCVELCQVSDTTINDRYLKELKLLDVIDDGQGRNGVLKVYSLSKSLGWPST